MDPRKINEIDDDMMDTDSSSSDLSGNDLSSIATEDQKDQFLHTSTHMTLQSESPWPTVQNQQTLNSFNQRNIFTGNNNLSNIEPNRALFNIYAFQQFGNNSNYTFALNSNEFFNDPFNHFSDSSNNSMLGNVNNNNNNNSHQNNLSQNETQLSNLQSDFSIENAVETLTNMPTNGQRNSYFEEQQAVNVLIGLNKNSPETNLKRNHSTAIPTSSSDGSTTSPERFTSPSPTSSEETPSERTSPNKTPSPIPVSFMQARRLTLPPIELAKRFTRKPQNPNAIKPIPVSSSFSSSNLFEPEPQTKKAKYGSRRPSLSDNEQLIPPSSRRNSKEKSSSDTDQEAKDQVNVFSKLENENIQVCQFKIAVPPQEAFLILPRHPERTQKFDGTQTPIEQKPDNLKLTNRNFSDSKFKSALYKDCGAFNLKGIIMGNKEAEQLYFKNCVAAGEVTFDNGVPKNRDNQAGFLFDEDETEEYWQSHLKATSYFEIFCGLEPKRMRFKNAVHESSNNKAKETAPSKNNDIRATFLFQIAQGKCPYIYAAKKDGKYYQWNLEENKIKIGRNFITKKDEELLLNGAYFFVVILNDNHELELRLGQQGHAFAALNIENIKKLVDHYILDLSTYPDKQTDVLSPTGPTPMLISPVLPSLKANVNEDKKDEVMKLFSNIRNRLAPKTTNNENNNNNNSSENNNNSSL